MSNKTLPPGGQFCETWQMRTQARNSKIVAQKDFRLGSWLDINVDRIGSWFLEPPGGQEGIVHFVQIFPLHLNGWGCHLLQVPTADRWSGGDGNSCLSQRNYRDPGQETEQWVNTGNRLSVNARPKPLTALTGKRSKVINQESVERLLHQRPSLNRDRVYHLLLIYNYLLSRDRNCCKSIRETE